MTMEDERNLDMMVAELEHENRLIRARNIRLEQEIETLTRERNDAVVAAHRIKETLERILSISKLALWDGRPDRVGEVGPSKHTRHPED